MTDAIFLTVAGILIVVDSINAHFLYRLSRRVFVVEGGIGKSLTDEKCREICRANAESISALLVVVSRHTEELIHGRAVTSANQAAIMSAVARLQASIPARIMPRAELEAVIQDLYNRTRERDPDLPSPGVDADIPIP